MQARTGSLRRALRQLTSKQSQSALGAGMTGPLLRVPGRVAERAALQISSSLNPCLGALQAVLLNRVKEQLVVPIFLGEVTDALASIAFPDMKELIAARIRAKGPKRLTPLHAGLRVRFCDSPNLSSLCLRETPASSACMPTDLSHNTYLMAAETHASNSRDTSGYI